MIKLPLDRFLSRIRRLEEERLYSRQGWRVPIRRVQIAKPHWPLSLKEWLMHPLIGVSLRAPSSGLRLPSPEPRA